MLIMAAGCNTIGRGTNQIDIFREMHYSQSVRFQEPPYIMPADGIPFASAGSGVLEVNLDTRIARSSDTENEGAQLYRVNCVACHGLEGKGDGPMREVLLKYKSIPPANFVATSAASTDQEIYNFVSLGGRTAALMAENDMPSLPETSRPGNMPVFSKLLTEEDRWKVVHYIRVLQGQ